MEKLFNHLTSIRDAALPRIERSDDARIPYIACGTVLVSCRPHNDRMKISAEIAAWCVEREMLMSDDIDFSVVNGMDASRLFVNALKPVLNHVMESASMRPVRGLSNLDRTAKNSDASMLAQWQRAEDSSGLIEKWMGLRRTWLRLINDMCMTFDNSRRGMAVVIPVLNLDHDSSIVHATFSAMRYLSHPRLCFLVLSERGILAEALKYRNGFTDNMVESVMHDLIHLNVEYP